MAVSSTGVVFSFNLHLALDSRRIVALPIGFDIGSGHSQIHVRGILGIRFRVLPWLNIGLYPFNPTYSRFTNDELKRKYQWWSFPTTIDLNFAI